MNSNNLNDMSSEILAILADLPNRINYDEGRYVTPNDFEVYTFTQPWASTALGFGGIGGQMITSANTWVLIPEVENQNCLVYFGGRFAYSVPYSEEFWNDVRKGLMEPVYRCGKYKKTQIL